MNCHFFVFRLSASGGILDIRFYTVHSIVLCLLLCYNYLDPLVFTRGEHPIVCSLLAIRAKGVGPFV